MKELFIEGAKITWDPADHSVDSYLLGQLLFGDHQHAIREDAKKAPLRDAYCYEGW